MMSVTEAAVLDALRLVQEPELGGDLITRNMVKDLQIAGTDVAFTIELTTPACPLKDEIEADVRSKLSPLGVDGQPKASASNKITPLERHGVKVISIQFFVPEGQPIVWRGPLIGGAIQQFLRDVEWGELDYLVIDLPPGTSDAQLTLAQAVPISGALLVTTPQDVALLDVAKALAMFRRLSVPVMGVVENMSNFICPHCGEATEIFGRGGGERFAQRNELEYFRGVPIDVKVRQGGDAGVPAVAQREPGAAAEVLRALARTVAARMSVRAAQAAPAITIS